MSFTEPLPFNIKKDTNNNNENPKEQQSLHTKDTKTHSPQKKQTKKTQAKKILNKQTMKTNPKPSEDEKRNKFWQAEILHQSIVWNSQAFLYTLGGLVCLFCLCFLKGGKLNCLNWGSYSGTCGTFSRKGCSFSKATLKWHPSHPHLCCPECLNVEGFWANFCQFSALNHI